MNFSPSDIVVLIVAAITVGPKLLSLFQRRTGVKADAAIAEAKAANLWADNYKELFVDGLKRDRKLANLMRRQAAHTVEIAEIKQKHQEETNELTRQRDHERQGRERAEAETDNLREIINTLEARITELETALGISPAPSASASSTRIPIIAQPQA